MSSGTAVPERAWRPAASRSRPWRAVGQEVGWLALGVLTFIGVTAWWLTQDDRVQDWDNGYHTMLSFTVHDELAGGHLTTPFTEFNTYPPLAHLVGALGVFVGGKSPSAVILALNLVFVPLLAAGCYGVGRLVYGRQAGLLAGLTGLAVPMFVSQMHVAMVDPAEAAMVAVSAWAILASQRFRRAGVAVLAGVLVGLALLTKQTSILFLAGLFVAVVGRGGWRNWRGLLAFVIVAAVVSVPWYAYHAHALSELVNGQEGTGAAPSAETAPKLLSVASLSWYLWNAINRQLLTPIVLFMTVGVVATIRGSLRNFTPENLGPELLAGGFVSWLAATLITHKDPRYTLPALVYVAVLSTGWIPVMTSKRLRILSTAVLGVVLAADFVGTSTGLGHAVRIRLPGATAYSEVLARQLTLYSPEGYVRGGPEHDADVLALMRGLKRAGVRTITFDAGSTNVDYFTQYGLEVRAIQAGLTPTSVYDPGGLGPRDAFMLRRVPVPGDPPPCQRLNDGSGIYIALGSAAKPFELYTFVCAGHHPEIYKRTAPIPQPILASVTSRIEGHARRTLERIMRAMRSDGVHVVQFDAGSANAVFFAYSGLVNLAHEMGLQTPAAYAPQMLGPHDAFMLRHSDGPSDPPPCARYSDGTGLYIVLGDPVIPFSDYRFYCPLRKPRFYSASAGR